MKKLLLILALATFGMFAQVPDGDGDDNAAVVPEPASLVLMGAGLAGVAYMGWKRNKKK